MLLVCGDCSLSRVNIDLSHQICSIKVGENPQELAKEDDHELEGALGFPLFTEGDNKLGWLINLNAVSSNITSEGCSSQLAAAVMGGECT